MRRKRRIELGPLCLDEANECLWRDGRAVSLRPKPYAVLCQLVERAGSLVTKRELLRDVWGGAVGDDVLKGAIRELRVAFEDSARSPTFIETVHRRGYRFLVQPRQSLPSEGKASVSLAGRARELDRLRGLLGDATAGRRRVTFVTGAPGMGKTALVEAFAAEAAQRLGVRTAVGACIEHIGACEAYLPFLEVVSRLAADPDGGRDLTGVLRERAPTWLAQLPWLVTPEEREALRRETLGTTRERMIRELAEALELWTADAPLVLVLEDLHWSDASTLDLLAQLARRPEPARLLVIGTFRPVDAILRENPVGELMRGLGEAGHASEVILEFLDPPALAALVEQRCRGHAFPPRFASWLHERTDGNPLFALGVLDHLRGRGELREVDGGGWKLGVPLDRLDSGLPESLRQMIGGQVELLGEREVEILETLALCGTAPTVAAVSAGLDEPEESVERVLEELVRRDLFVRRVGERQLPNGAASRVYGLAHALVGEVLRERVPPARRQAIALRVAMRGKEVYGPRSAEIAPELAQHFDRGDDVYKATEYLRIAAAEAYRRWANREASAYLYRALQMLEGRSGVDAACARAHALEQLGMVHRSSGEMSRAADAFVGMAREASNHGRVVAEVRARSYAASAYSWFDRDACLASAARAGELAEACDDPSERACARGFAGYWTLLWDGWHTDAFRMCAEAEVTSRGAEEHRISWMFPGRFGFLLSLRSEHARALRLVEASKAHAVRNEDPFEFLLFGYYRAWALLFAGEREAARREAGEGIRMAEHNGHRKWSTLLRLLSAWSHLESGHPEGALDRLDSAIAAAQIDRHDFGLLLGLALRGNALLDLGRTGEAEPTIARAEEVERAGVLMGWIAGMPLAQARARYELARGALEAAADAAARLRRRADGPGEATFGRGRGSCWPRSRSGVGRARRPRPSAARPRRSRRTGARPSSTASCAACRLDRREPPMPGRAL